MAKENNADLDDFLSFLDSDEGIKKIQKTHFGLYEYDVRPLVAIVENIMTLAARPPFPHLEPSLGDGLVKYADKDVKKIAKTLESPINYISYKMAWKCVDWVDLSDRVTMELLEYLSHYSWDAKAVITCAAFAINYGEFSVLTHESSDKSIATLMGIRDDASFESYHSEHVRSLLLTVKRLTRCIASNFIELHLKPYDVYLIIRALVVCASLLKDIVCDQKKSETGRENTQHATARHIEHIVLSRITDTSKEILSKVQRRLSPVMTKFEDQVKKFRELNEFQKIMSTSHEDNMKVLSAFFCHREDQRPLYHGIRSINERLDVLRLKYVLLLISDLDISQEELIILHLIHAMRHDCEILWLPIADLHGAPLNEKQFIDLRNNMPWFSADHPSAIEPLAIKYIREELRFSHMPMLVVLDPHGKLSHHNALPMMWIWGIRAFPFTRDRERKLWEDTDWHIDLIVDSIDPRIPEWIFTNRVICLYGGDDVNWVRKFTQAAKTAARDLNVQLEMLYVGKRNQNQKQKVRLCHEVIAREKLSHIFATDYYDFVWYFWVRLSSMWNSKKQIGRTVENDHIMQGILDLLTYDSSKQGWAIFSRGNYEITMASGDKFVHILDIYKTWGNEVDHPDKFVPVLDKHLKGYHPEHHCHRLILPGEAEYNPERVVCMECRKTMDKYVMYHCCYDQGRIQKWAKI